MTDRPSERMRRRLLVWMTVIMLIVVIYTVACIFKVSVKESKKWQTLANSQQITSTTVSASRGTIYDTNGQVLAQSATVYTVYTDCAMLWEYLDAKDDKILEYKAAIADESDEKKRAGYQEKLDACKSSQETYDSLVKFMAKTLDLDESKIEGYFSDKNSRYVIMKKR